MKVKHWMTPDPITVDSDTLIVDAKKIMKDHQIRRLPVVDKGKLTGIVTYRNIIEASPSAATSLSIHELNYLILKLKVGDVMRKKPVTVSADDLVIDVILEGHKKGIGAFPVVDEKSHLVGIITETELFSAVVGIFGRRENSQIVCLENIGSEDSVGDFRRISQALESISIPIMAIFTLPKQTSPGQRIYVRVKTKDTRDVIQVLAKEGYQVCV